MRAVGVEEERKKVQKKILSKSPQSVSGKTQFFVFFKMALFINCRVFHNEG